MLAPLSISTHPTAELVPTPCHEMDNSRTNRGKKMMMTMMMMTASHGQTTTASVRAMPMELEQKSNQEYFYWEFLH